MPIATRCSVTAALTALAVAATLLGCSSGTPSGGMLPDGSGSGAVSRAPVQDSSLASAVDLLPDMPDGTVLFTDWSMLHHDGSINTDRALFAGQWRAVDDQLHRDLGFRSTDAEWELDVWQTGRPTTVVLRFARHADLAGLARKLIRFGYRRDRSILTGPLDQRRLWTYMLHNVGIDPGRQVLVAGADATAVQSVFAGPAHPLGLGGSVTPLLAQVSARLGRVATASILVGSRACVTLTELAVHATPLMLAALRRDFRGTFTPPQAEIIALADPTDTTALDALAFPDHGVAQANRAARLAAVPEVSALAYGDPNEVRVTRSTVSGRVLSFELTASDPHNFPDRVASNGLGVDICP